MFSSIANMHTQVNLKKRGRRFLHPLKQVVSTPEIFMKDYCTLWPDRWRVFIGGKWLSYDISGCCRMHDERYADASLLRKAADIELYL